MVPTRWRTFCNPSQRPPQQYFWRKVDRARWSSKLAPSFARSNTVGLFPMGSYEIYSIRNTSSNRTRAHKTNWNCRSRNTKFSRHAAKNLSQYDPQMQCVHWSSWTSLRTTSMVIKIHFVYCWLLLNCDYWLLFLNYYYVLCFLIY